MLPEYNPTRSLERAWNAIPGDKPALFWETGFWSQLFDNSGGADLSVLQRDLKRPRVVGELELDVPVSKQPKRNSAGNHEDFHDVVRDITIMDWREEREAKWETAIRRWRVSILSWNPHVRITQILASKDNFKDQAQILVDVSAERCNSLGRLINYMSVVHAKFPCTETQLYDFFCRERVDGAAPSRMQSVIEALACCKHILGVEDLDECILSRRCAGVAARPTGYTARACFEAEAPQDYTFGTGLRRQCVGSCLLRNGPFLCVCQSLLGRHAALLQAGSGLRFSR